MSLKGRRILLLRPAGREAEPAGALEQLGATVVSVPAIEICPPASEAPIWEAIDRANEFDWAIFTSVHGVRAVFGRGRPEFRRLAAIGPSTAEALNAGSAARVWVPSEFTTQALGSELPKEGRSVCLFRAAAADPALDRALAARGFEVTRVDAYDTRRTPARAIREAVARGVDAVALTSASIARALAAATSLPSETSVACIGPATARACEEAGIRVDAVARPHTAGGLATALEILLSD